MLFVIHIVIFTGVLAATSVLMKWWNERNKPAHRCPPSLPSLPLVGSLPFLRNFNNVSVFFAQKAKELGPIFTLRVGTKLVLTLNSRDAIEKAVVRNFAVFSDRPELFMEKLINPNAKGIGFIPKATEWKKHQHLALTILRDLGFGVKSTMERRIITEIEAITEYATKKNGDSFDPAELILLAVSNIINNFLFGRRQEYDLGLPELFVQLHHYAAKISPIFDVLPFTRYIPMFRRVLRDVQDTTRRLFEIMEQEIDLTAKNPTEPCFVRSYIQKLESDQDREQVNYMIRDLGAAGSDTSYTTLRWGLIAMANYQDVQKRMHAEIDALLPGDQLPTLQDQARLPYIEATILEIYRWRTLAPLAIPHTASRDSVLDGYFIPGGTMVLLNLYAVHSDVDVWKDPEVFRPERFLDEENNVIGKDLVIPFSIGRRSCLGKELARAEIFLILTSLVKRFLILPPDGQDKISEDYAVPVPIVLSPLPFKIRLIYRK